MPEPSEESKKATARQMRDECEGWFANRPEAALFDWRVAAKNALAAAYTIDAPRFHAEGFEAGRAAMRDELRAMVQRERELCSGDDGEHPYWPLDRLLLAIEAAFPTTGETTDA